MVYEREPRLCDTKKIKRKGSFFALDREFEMASELAQRKRVGLITQRSSDRNRDSLVASRLAQLVERKTLNLVVEGSIPSEGVFLNFFCKSVCVFRKVKIKK